MVLWMGAATCTVMLVQKIDCYWEMFPLVPAWCLNDSRLDPVARPEGLTGVIAVLAG